MSKRIRLDKLLSSMGHGSRAEIKRVIKAGRATVDGKPEKDSGRIINPDLQVVALDGETVMYREKIYLMLHKPPGVISATEDSRERTVIDLLAPEDRVLEPFPVGRLDKDTEGLLLLTNDGQLAHELLSPRKHVTKTYEALVRGPEAVGEWERERFRQGVELDDGYVTLPAELEILSWKPQEPDVEAGEGEGISLDKAAEVDKNGVDVANSDSNRGGAGDALFADEEENAKNGGVDDGLNTDAEDGGAAIISSIRLTIHEGKFHQVKRMFQAVGGKVIYLKRISMGPLVLDEELPIGSYRELTEDELSQLQPEALKEAKR
ncbi:pseudouridine synthase [Paenibacillus herberti]|uniref:Pseudouridine synthase n=1 Tax=Paenibacillus herberti TaxID=1619309 RepID=A0A229P3Q8_9BACL|nr:pseudouridine synthase [Paenibacillus herberti]OXM16883.1 16S rRNA pseudouridine(516) synthase [Paenibacillus herberti]